MVSLAVPLAGLAVAVVALTAHARPSTVSDFAICNREAIETAGPVSAFPGPGDRGRRDGLSTDSTGKIVAGTKDPLVEGMAADRADDAAYQTAYRECMARRGITTQP